MAETITFQTLIYQAWLQMGTADSGETPSTQQQNDALTVANELLYSWYQEQTLALQELLSEQQYAGTVFVAGQNRVTAPLVLAFNMAGGFYQPPVYTPGYFNPGVVPQFGSINGSVNVPAGYGRALMLGLAVELCPQYDMQPSPALLKNLAEARAAASPVPGKVPVPGTSGTQAVPPPGSPPVPAAAGGE